MVDEGFDFGTERTKLDMYLEEGAVSIRLGGENYHGVLKHVCPEQDAVYLQPSLVGKVDGSGFHIESRLPTMVPFNGHMIVTPIKGLEELVIYVRNFNAAKGIKEDERGHINQTDKSGFDYNGALTRWDVFLGEAVCVKFGKENYHGVVRKVSPEQEVVYLQPSLIWDVDGSRLRLEARSPTMVPFNGCSVIPVNGIRELTDYVRQFNTKKEAEEIAKAQVKSG